jgi:hypothetical protein
MINHIQDFFLDLLKLNLKLLIITLDIMVKIYIRVLQMNPFELIIFYQVFLD